MSQAGFWAMLLASISSNHSTPANCILFLKYYIPYCYATPSPSSQLTISDTSFVACVHATTELQELQKQKQRLEQE